MNSPTILIVDDNAKHLKALHNQLCDQGYVVHTASSGTDALDQVQDIQPDLILLNHLMANMDGYEVCWRLKANESLADVPVIFFGDSTATTDKVRGFEVGGIDYIAKPIDAEELLARIATHLTLSCHKQNEETIRHLIEVSSQHFGNTFFESIAIELTRILGVDYAIVGQMHDATPDHIQTITVANQGALLDNFDYSLEGTPCANVVDGNICTYPANVADLFPEDTMLKDLNIESYSGIPLLDTNGTPLGIVAILHRRGLSDTRLIESVLRVLSPRVASEIERLKAQRDYRMLFDSMIDGFALHEMIFDDDGRPVDYRFLTANPAFEKMTGLIVEDIIGKTVLEIMPNTEPQWIERYGRVVISGEPVTFEHYARALNKHFEVTAYRPAKGQFACVFIDITARKRAEAEQEELEHQLRQSQKMEAVGLLAGGIAHDFNNLLTVIFAGVDQLAHHLPDLDDHLKSCLDLVRDAAMQASGVTKSLLTFSRKLPAEKSPIDLRDVVDHTKRMLKRMLPASIHLAIDDSVGTPLFVHADATQIQQVIMNLAINARDAMDNGGTLGIRLSKASPDKIKATTDETVADTSYVKLTISDTGHGISTDAQSHIFEPFFSTKPRGQGTGLGLAIVHSIVKEHGGIIQVQSKQGKGTVFVLLFPQITHEASMVKTPIDHLALTSARKRVLVVDDNPQILTLLVTNLKSQGYDVLQATDGKKLLESWQAERDRIDLIVTDMDMPRQTGLACIQHIRETGDVTPAILISGMGDDELAAQLDSNTVLLGKPFQIAEFGRQVKSLLARVEVPLR